MFSVVVRVLTVTEACLDMNAAKSQHLYAETGGAVRGVEGG